MQYVLNFKRDPEALNKEICDILDECGVPHEDIDIIYRENKKGKMEVDRNPTWIWGATAWLKFFIKKGFCIDCYSSYDSVYAGSESICVIHKIC